MFGFNFLLIEVRVFTFYLKCWYRRLMVSDEQLVPLIRKSFYSQYIKIIYNSQFKK